MASNLTQATRELLDKTWRSAISYGIPLFTRLAERDQIIPGGIRYEQIYESADMKSLVQWYTTNTPLTGGSKEIIEKPHWHAAYVQCPVEEDVDERVMNAPSSDAQLIKIRNKIAKGALMGIKYSMADWMYGCAGDTDFDATHTRLQGLCSALMEDKLYAGIDNTGTSYEEWQPADEDNWDAAYAINKANLDAWLDAVSEFAEDGQDILILMGTTLWRRLKQQFEASNIYTPKANRAKQGFDSMEYNGVEIAKDHLLERMTQTGPKKHGTADGTMTVGGSNYGLCGDSKTGDAFVFVLDLKTWHLRYFEDKEGGTGPFEMTDFFDQDKILGGVEKKLARIKWKGQLTCDMPNRNLMRAAVT